MATRFYFHAAASGVGGTLPATEQSSRTAGQNFDAQSVNRSMNTTIGVSQASLSKTMTIGQTDVQVYVTKYISLPLDMTAIAANTWTLTYATKISNTTEYYWPTGGVNGNVPSTLYVWRPSTGTKVGNIFDTTAATATNTNENTSELSVKLTYTGSARSGVQTGDVLVFEQWARVAENNSSATYYYYYDGTTVVTTDGTSVASMASFLETPENLTFYTPPIDCISTYQTIQNKFITIV